MFSFKIFHAKSNPELCKLYAECHVKVLKDYGITNITSNNNEWMTIDTIYGIVVHNEAGTMVGGIRVQMANGINLLPVEKAIGHLDPNIHSIIKEFIPNGVGELSALWNAKEVAGLGLSLLLSRAGIAMSNQFGCNIMVGICADYTMEMFRRVGFVVNKGLGNAGSFVYPNENYVARVLGILNANDLATADEFDRERMLSLRLKPQQTAIELGAKNVELKIDYDLKL
jgi:hypothetical protein